MKKTATKKPLKKSAAKKSIAKSAAKPAAKSVAKTGAKPAAKKDVKSVSKPAVKPAVKKAIAKPAVKKPVGSSAAKNVFSARLFETKISEHKDWRGKTLAMVRSMIKEADPQVAEELKWRGVPVWSHDGIICTGETYKSVVKLTFANGASLKDPANLFNSSLEGNQRRAIDIHENQTLDKDAFQTLIREAISFNQEKRR